MQAGLGNRGMQRLLSRTLQRQESPELEEEELQMKRDPLRTLQRQEAPELEEEELQMKRDPSRTLQRQESPESEEEEIQMKRDTSQPIQRSGSKMPESVQMKMENAMGHDFSNVNIHEGAEAGRVGALAYAQGNDIHFAPGRYNPDTRAGQELLGHELAHVVQQREGRVKPTASVNGLALNDDKSLESEADRLGAKAALGQ
jgi:flagellar biosynthesis GTPase FlhF